MYINRDIYGEYKECLNCGNMVDIESPGRRHAPVRATATMGAKKSRRKVA
jgi:hypothetical protein